MFVLGVFVVGMGTYYYYLCIVLNTKSGGYSAGRVKKVLEGVDGN